jgi:hypothetical protein
MSSGAENEITKRGYSVASMRSSPLQIIEIQAFKYNAELFIPCFIPFDY